MHGPGPKHGQPNRRRRWHPECVLAWDRCDPREQRRIVRRRDRGVCRACGVDTLALKREIRGRGRTRKLRELGFHPRRSLWELDHVVPLIDGGGHETSNLQTLCVPCHRAKSAQETKLRARGRVRPVRRRVASRPRSEAVDLDSLLARADAANARVEALLSRPA